MSESESGELGDRGAIEDEVAVGSDWSWVNWGVIGVFTALTVVGIALAVGRLEWVVAVPEGGTNADTVTIPLYVYLYSGLGALGYIFTKLMVTLERYTDWNRVEQLAAMALRVPAAWILATGVYLFLGDVAGSTGGGARFVAGVAFLVGLYVNVALKALGSLADRILGRGARRASERPSTETGRN